MIRKIIERDEGFYCVVDGEEFGAWRSRAEALAGYEVEKRRAERRKAERKSDTNKAAPAA